MARRGRHSVGMYLKTRLIIASFVEGFKVFCGIMMVNAGKKREKKVKQLHQELISFIESKHPPTQGPRGSQQQLAFNGLE